MLSRPLGLLQGSISGPDRGLQQGRLRVEKLLQQRLISHGTGSPGPNIPDFKEPLDPTQTLWLVLCGARG